LRSCTCLTRCSKSMGTTLRLTRFGGGDARVCNS
jgi:hypothetical protein